MLIPLILTWGDVFFTEIENRSTSRSRTERWKIHSFHTVPFAKTTRTRRRKRTLTYLAILDYSAFQFHCIPKEIPRRTGSSSVPVSVLA